MTTPKIDTGQDEVIPDAIVGTPKGEMTFLVRPENAPTTPRKKISPMKKPSGVEAVQQLTGKEAKKAFKAGKRLMKQQEMAKATQQPPAQARPAGDMKMRPSIAEEQANRAIAGAVRELQETQQPVTTEAVERIAGSKLGQFERNTIADATIPEAGLHSMAAQAAAAVNHRTVDPQDLHPSQQFDLARRALEQVYSRRGYGR